MTGYADLAGLDRTPSLAGKGEIQATTARILTIDIECSPNLVWAWGLWKQNINRQQIVQPQRMICFAARWLGESNVIFSSEHHHGHEAMTLAAWNLINQADAVVTYNGDNYDIPHLQTAFDTYALPEPIPPRSIDLIKVARRLKYPSRALAYIAEALKLEQLKGENEGFALWTKCLAGDPVAWAAMKTYNMQDVRTTEAAFVRWQHRVKGGLNFALFVDGNISCPYCGCLEMHREGNVSTPQTLFSAYRCANCGGISRSVHRSANTQQRPIR